MNAIVSIYIFAIFMLIFCYNLCYAKLTNQKFYLTGKNLMITLLCGIFDLINTTYCPVAIKIIINFILFCAELKLIFHDELKVVIINYIFIFLLLSLIEMIIVNILLLCGLLQNSNSANSISLLNMWLSILVGIIEYLLLKIKWIIRKCQWIINLFLKHANLTNLIYLSFIIMCLIGIFNIDNFANSHSIKFIFILYIIFTILIFMIIHSKLNEESLKNSNKKLVKYNEKYGKFLDEYKIYKHNINHKLSAMKVFGNKKINALIDELLNEENDFNMKNSNIYNIPDGIKGLVAEKLYNINVNVMINNNIEGDPFIKLKPKAFHSMAECLGISLDNALEASEETENPVIMLDLNEDKENIYIKVGNNFNNNIDLVEMGNKYYSTKNRGSGLGLFSIMNNRYVKENINIINNFYSIELQIKKHAE